MKKIIFIALLFFAVKLSYSDQLQWITKQEAEKTIEYFKDLDIKEVVLWCACCDNDPMRKIRVSGITYAAASDPNYYEIYITGTASDGTKIDGIVDLAYVHVLRWGKWRCLGKMLKFECDPCTKPFEM